MIRSVPASPQDRIYCMRLGQAAVHAAMAGKTGLVVARWHSTYMHLPVSVATSARRTVDPGGDLWLSVLEATGQPPRFIRRSQSLRGMLGIRTMRRRESNECAGVTRMTLIFGFLFLGALTAGMRWISSPTHQEKRESCSPDIDEAIPKPATYSQSADFLGNLAFLPRFGFRTGNPSGGTAGYISFERGGRVELESRCLFTCFHRGCCLV